MTLNAQKGDYNITYMTVSEIRKNSEATGPEFIVNWLRQKHIYFILSQGIHPGMFELWKCWECRTAVLALYDRIGFPSGDNLKCPVWNGDKMGYSIIANLMLP